MLDINHIREKKGGNIEAVKESQRRRNASVELIDECVALDVAWRLAYEFVATTKGRLNKANKAVGMKKKAKEDAKEEIAAALAIKAEVAEAQVAEQLAEKKLWDTWATVGNIVADSVPVEKDEDHNRVDKTHKGVPDLDEGCVVEGTTSHDILMHRIGGFDQERGTKISGHRGYFLTGVGVLLNQALINFGLASLMKREYTPMQPPFFMRRDIMAKTAQLSTFHEDLYKVSGSAETSGNAEKDAADESYLIATSEQPISAYHCDEWIPEGDLPLRYAGYSTCFRKEAGSSGKEVRGLFRVHQFEKVEQFVLTHPDKSEEELQSMLEAAETFYQDLGIGYRVVSIVSGALNDAAAKKYDVEAWFPHLQDYRELVSASNCTDYQARNLEVRLRTNAKTKEKVYCHMLNSTLCATERTLCCVLENNQGKNAEGVEGVHVPKALRPYMGGLSFLPFVRDAPSKGNTGKKKKK